jgi:hypothetical protein
VAMSSVTAFTTPSVSSRSCVFASTVPSFTKLYSSEPEEEEEGLDLNLEEMFDM